MAGGGSVLQTMSRLPPTHSKHVQPWACICPAGRSASTTCIQGSVMPSSAQDCAFATHSSTTPLLYGQANPSTVRTGKNRMLIP